MILPSSISSNWITSVGVSAESFKQAEILFGQEDFKRSKHLLETSILPDPEMDSVPGVKVVSLYAWNLFYLKKPHELDNLLEVIESDLGLYPEIQLIQVRRQIQAGKQEAALKTCINYLENHNDPISPLVPDFLFAKGMAEYKSGNCKQAAEDLEVSYSLFKLLGNRPGMGLAGNYLGFVNLRLAKYRESLRWLDRAYEVFEGLGLPRKQSMVLLNMGIANYKRGNIPESLDLLKRSQEIGIKGNWTHRQLFPNIALGNVHRIKRDYTSARIHLHTAFSQAQELQFPREEALALEFLGDVYRDEGLYTDAIRFYRRGLAIGQTIAPEGDIVMEIHRRLGECQFALQNRSQAQVELEKALELARAQEDRFEEAVILRVLAEFWQEGTEIGRARNYIDESISILGRIGARFELALSLMSSSELALEEIELGRPSRPLSSLLTRAWENATQAMDQLLQVDVPWWTERCQGLIRKTSFMRDQHEITGGKTKSSLTGESKGAYQSAKVIIHQSRKMKDLLHLCDMFAQSREPALIVGETGTGKELLARRLHEFSGRSGGHLVSINVTAIPESLFEREFFGHVKGAFSGAENNSPGLAERAHGGTLFLDEIGDLPLEVQPKLLRLLQEGTYLALGDPVERKADIRLVAATNADLCRKVQAGEFRSDLYYRLKTLELELPPVRDRQEDILLLLRHFLSDAADRPVDLSDYFSRHSLDQMEQFEWPGNVREIAMVARRAHMEFKAKGRVGLDLIRPNGGRIRLTGTTEPRNCRLPGPYQSTSDAVERTRILMALEENGGSRSEAARQLEISRSTLYRRLTKLGLNC